MATLDTRSLVPHLAAMRLNRDIAADLGVTENDVRAKLSDLCRQYGKTIKLELCLLAQRGKLQ